MKAAPSFSAQKLVLSLSIAVGFTLTRVVTLAVRSRDTSHDDSIEEEQCTEACCEKFQEECPSANPLNVLPLAVQIIFIFIFISLSALFSGLTLGLLGLDKTGLEIIMDGGDETNAAYARIIYPIRKNGNLLLCTLLLGNTAVNALLSILLADKAGGIIGFLASTFIILIFGEITPQALCSRYALEIGSKAVPLVRVIMVILYPITKPLSWVLDQALGEELATTYSSSELLKMLEIHVKENALDQDTANTMTGALTFKDTRVRQVMTPIANTFMLSMDEKLNFETIAAIFKTGYSRIPIYEISQVRRLQNNRDQRSL
jgi:metal transporter CNNM